MNNTFINSSDYYYQVLHTNIFGEYFRYFIHFSKSLMFLIIYVYLYRYFYIGFAVYIEFNLINLIYSACVS